MEDSRRAKYILALDPGTTETGVCILKVDDYRPLMYAKITNEHVMDMALDWIQQNSNETEMEVVIEMVASYGMPVGAEVFETCVWIGRFEERALQYGLPVHFIYRKDEKLTICQSPKANDATIKQALVDRFAKGTPNYGKGSKKAPGWFYGFSKDVWSAYAVGVTYIDMNF